MPILTRRHALIAAAAIPALAVAGCAGLSGGSVVAITQTVLTDLQNVVAGLNLLQGTKGQPLIPAATLASIETYMGDAQSVLTKIAAAVGGTVSSATAQGIITDLESAANAIAPFFPGNPYLLAVEALLPIVAAALGVLLPASVKRDTMPAADARRLLGGLPRPTPVK